MIMALQSYDPSRRHHLVNHVPENQYSRIFRDILVCTLTASLLIYLLRCIMYCIHLCGIINKASVVVVLYAIIACVTS
jgi:hypothetical protein